MCSNGALPCQVHALECAVDALLDLDLGATPDADLTDALDRIAAGARTLTGFTARIAHQHKKRQAGGAHRATATELPFPADEPAAPGREPISTPQRDHTATDRALLPETTAASWLEE